MKDACGIEEVTLQENGIIRNEDGMIIGRLVQDINAFAEKHYQRGYEDGLRKAREMKTNHDGTVTLNAYDSWISCTACGKRVTGDSIHTCSPQLRELTDEEIQHIQAICHLKDVGYDNFIMRFARAILRKAQGK
jgi:hypothetical protein